MATKRIKMNRSEQEKQRLTQRFDFPLCEILSALNNAAVGRLTIKTIRK